MADEQTVNPNSIDPAALTEAARLSLGLPAFQLTDWSVSPLDHEKTIETTGGLFCFSGHGWDGQALMPWSVILKVICQPENESPQPHELGYWKRELLVYQSGLLSALPASLGAPRCFGVSEQAQRGWLWLENIQETVPRAWDMAHFQRAARCLGKFAGDILVKESLQSLSRFPWLLGSLFRSLYAGGEWWARFTNPESASNAWQCPVVQAVYPEWLQKRVLQIWREKERFLDANERLPQVFCHNDAHRRNLMLRGGEAGQEELVAIDWAFCGPGGLGNDLGELVGTSLSYFAVDPVHAADLERAALEGYLAGLRDAGWDGDGRLARLGYLVSLALYWGGTLPCEAALAQPGASRVNVEAKYGRPLEAVLPGWTRLAEFALDRADEARYWIGRLI